MDSRCNGKTVKWKEKKKKEMYNNTFFIQWPISVGPKESELLGSNKKRMILVDVVTVVTDVVEWK